jgi:hypothetical protein
VGLGGGEPDGFGGLTLETARSCTTCLRIVSVNLHNGKYNSTHWRGDGEAEERDESSESLDLHFEEY